MSPLRALAYARAHRKKSLAELMDFVRFPTVGAQPAHEGDIRNCASWLAGHLRRIGLDDVRIFPTAGHPLVYGGWRGAPGRPALLIYGHYDLQPADPLHEWRSPPFEPTIRRADLSGRGACDDKGQMFTHVKALEAYLQTEHALPVNVKCLFEGEEEIGSPNLLPFVARHDRHLAADVAVLSDTPMLGPGRPAITHAVRRALYLELEVRGPKGDLHSGNFGGAVHNPLQALREIIAALHDADGRIAIPGFYGRVRRWSAKERSYMADTGPSNAEFLDAAQTERSWGESGYSSYERLTLRPALTINGIIGGYQGPGAKGIVPARAVAKLSFRLAPDQDPRAIDRLFREHVARITPKTVRSTVRTLSSALPAVIERRHPAMRAAALAYRHGFGAAPVFPRSGGTIPVVNTFQQALGIPAVMMGFALPDDHMHAPNEKFHLPNFFNGIAASIWFLTTIGAARNLGSKWAREACAITLAAS